MTLNPTDFCQSKLIRLRAIESTDMEHILRWNRDSERARLLDLIRFGISDDMRRLWP